MSDTLQLGSVKKIRDTKDQFSKPNFISFDVFGTLYTPKKSIGQQYHDIASNEFGIKKSLEFIDTKFPIIYSKLTKKYPNYGKYDPKIETCDDWWSELIVELFKLPHYRNDKTSAMLCKRLLDHFTGPEAYRLYDDVIPTLTTLKENGIKLLVSSNSDPRVFQILENLGLSRFFDNEDVYLSFNLGILKPDKRYFDKVVHDFLSKESNTHYNQIDRVQFLEGCWHIGDNYNVDVLGAVKAGWNGILLDREQTSQLFANSTKCLNNSYPACFSEQSRESDASNGIVLIANNRAVITSLNQLPRMFDLDPV